MVGKSLASSTLRWRRSRGGGGEKEKVLLKIKPERFLKGSLDPGEESEGSS